MNKMQKIQPLPNPHYTTTSSVVTDSKLELFSLNERTKIRMTQSSVEEEFSKGIQPLSYRTKNSQTAERKQISKMHQTNVEKQNYEQIVLEENIFPEKKLERANFPENFFKNKNISRLEQGVSENSSNKFESSFIQRIKEENFANSRVIQDEQPKRTQYFEKAQQNNPEKKRKMRKKIFEKKYLAENRSLPGEMERRPEFYHETHSEGCPHTHCLMRSLAIIDKMVEQKGNTHKKDRHIMNQQDIEKSIFQIQLQVDHLHALPLEEIKKPQIKSKINWASIACQQLIRRIKSEPFSDRSLFQTVENLSLKIYYFQLIHQKFNYWKKKFHTLENLTKEFALSSQPEKIQRISELNSYISQINQSFIQQPSNNLKLISQYNNFLQREEKYIESAINWVKANFL